MLGLKKGTLQFYSHEKQWELEAKQTISCLYQILGSLAKDIQHIGSTSIPTIKARPIIDIVIAMEDYKDILALEKEFNAIGFYLVRNDNLKNQLLFCGGSYYDGTGDLETHYIYVVSKGSIEWNNYIIFRDYLNKSPFYCKKYEELKKSLPLSKVSDKYSHGGDDFILYILRKSIADYYLGKTVDIKIDRAIGSIHPKHSSLIYPVNYGYIPGVLGGDGEELDVYLLGVDEPVEEYRAQIIAIVHRHNDIEDKLVATPYGINFNKKIIEELIHFQEQFYNIEIETIPPLNFLSKDEIHKGWSDDKKYCVSTNDGVKY